MLSLFSQSWRTWRHAPAVAILTISALALGVTATTAIYTFIQAVLLKPLPYANPDRYLMVLSKWRGVASPVENAIHSVDPQFAVYAFGTIEEREQNFLRRNRLQSDMTLLFALTALVLPVLGVYCVVS